MPIDPTRYKEYYPTKAWRERMEAEEEPDEVFTEELLDITDAALDAFLDELVSAKGDKAKVKKCIERSVKKFNRLNRKHSHIDTMEREELCEFFQIVADDHELESEDPDITWEWRTDW